MCRLAQARCARHAQAGDTLRRDAPSRGWQGVHGTRGLTEPSSTSATFQDASSLRVPVRLFPDYRGAAWPVQGCGNLFKLARAQLRSKLTSKFAMRFSTREGGTKN